MGRLRRAAGARWLGIDHDPAVPTVPAPRRGGHGAVTPDSARVSRMTEGHGYRNGTDGSVSATELVNRYGQSPAAALGRTRRDRRRRTAVLAAGGVVAAAAIAGTVALRAPDASGPHLPATAADPDDADERTATATDVTQPLPGPITGASPSSAPVSTERTGPGGPAPTPTAGASPQQAEREERTTPDAPGSATEAPSSETPPSQPPASRPPPEDGPLARVLQPILG